MSKLYTVITDLWHTFLGIATALLARYNEKLGETLFIYPSLGIIAPLLIIITYMAYQSLDDDPPEERVGDLVEYSAGMILGSVINI
jgi:hypothetical protein